MTVRLRAHHLLCILTYVGKGYSPAFTDNMTVIAKRIAGGEAIEIVDGPDVICAPRRAETNPHCRDGSVQLRDLLAAQDIGTILEVSVQCGERLTLDKRSLKKLRAAFVRGEIRPACRHCRWDETCTAVATNGYRGTFL